MQNNLKSIGRMSLSKYFLWIGCVLITLPSIAQKRKAKQKEPVMYPVTKVLEKDSVIIFTLDQGRELARINEDKKRLEKLNKKCEFQLKFKDSIILLQEQQIVDYQSIKLDYDLIVKQMNRMQQLCGDEKKLLNKEIKKQKRQKWASIGIGVSSFAILSYFYTNK